MFTDKSIKAFYTNIILRKLKLRFFISSLTVELMSSKDHHYHCTTLVYKLVQMEIQTKIQNFLYAKFNYLQCLKSFIHKNNPFLYYTTHLEQWFSNW